LPKNQTNNKKLYLIELRKGIQDLRKNVQTNFHRELLKKWAFLIGIGLSFIFGLLFFFSVLSFYNLIQFPSPGDTSKIFEITPTVFTATITVIGIIIGFVPLISFFFVEGLRRDRRDLIQNWEKDSRNLKNEELELTNQYYILLFTIDHNLESGVLRYTQTFTAVSITLLLCLISTYISTTALGIVPLSAR